MKMKSHHIWLGVLVLLLLARPVPGQTPPLNSSQASGFMGTWTFAMTNLLIRSRPSEFGTKNGVLARAYNRTQTAERHHGI